MTNVKLSQIAPSPSNVAATTQFVAVEGGNTDLLFSPSQFINGFNLLRSSVADQTLSGGWNVVAHTNAAGSGVTIDCGQGPLQTFTNNVSGGVTITAPGNDGQTILQITNGSTPGVVTFSGFTVGNNVGDPLPATAGNVYSVYIWRVNGISQYYTIAVQGGNSSNFWTTAFNSTVSGVGGTARADQDRWSDVVNVKDFGALGNNSHDDTAAINAAIVAAATQTGGLSAFRGGTVFFPTGVYKVTGPLFNNTSQTFVDLVGVDYQSSYILGTVGQVPSPTQSGFVVDQNDGTGLGPGGDNLGAKYFGTIARIENLHIKNTAIPIRVWAANVITAGSWSNATGGGLITFTTTTAHTVVPGQYFTISGCSPSGYNGNFIAQTGTTGSTLIGSKTWTPSLVAPNTNPGAFVSGGTLVAQTTGFDPSVGAVRFNNAANGIIRNCQIDGFNGICCFNNAFANIFDSVYMLGFNNQPGSVGFNGANTMINCTAQGYWVGFLGCTSIGAWIYSFRVETCQTSVLIGVSPTDGVTTSSGSSFHLIGLQTERCENTLTIHSLQTGFFADLIITGIIGVPHNATFNGNGTTATVTLITTNGQPTLDQVGWPTNGTTRLIRVEGGGLYAAGSFVTGTRISNTSFSYLSTGTAVNTNANWSLQINNPISINSLAKLVTITACNTSTPVADLHGSHYLLSATTAANITLIGCTGPAGTALWQMPPAVCKSAYQYINCDQPAGATLDNASVQSGMNFADLPGQTSVQQPGPITGMQYDITNCNTAVWGATAAGGGSTLARVRYNGTNWTVMGI